ncbi:uncharacterized protein F4822DRAFT_400125 [Hypoxylon trugodes]|uniref:uncharacterized protein n=1 Tax=Hypoxylon trugodes TaxID=326681 RepID=UPI00218EEC44|nr:uncharacterized protein F4822DRAFT_400125 [Hypoxylon trugodes]KAI1389888.1 hypothetical protein F4822DRAFT_400125 [Hypoxylon trugodes]
MAMVRFAILAFLPRLAQDRNIKIISWTVAAIIFAQTVAAFTYRLASCTPVADSFKLPDEPGLKCVGLDDHIKMMAGHGLVGIVIDVILLLLPIWVICTKMMWSKKTLQIILVLSVGMFAVATGILRVALTRTRDISSDLTWEMPTLGIWTNIEGHVGLWCSCFPTLQPILRSVPAKLKLLSSTNGNGGRHDRTTGHTGVTKATRGRRMSLSELDSESQRGITLQETKGVEITGTQDSSVHSD